MDLASLRISFGMPSLPVARFGGNFFSISSNSYSVIGGWSFDDGWGRVSGMSCASKTLWTMEVHLNNSSACSSLSVARDLSLRYKGATAFVVWV